MQPKINYHYTISNKDVSTFDFTPKNPIVDESCYYHRIMPNLPYIINMLRDKPDSRQAVIMTNNNTNLACLLSLQFQIENGRLIVLAVFRSQHKRFGRPYDTEMLQYIATLVKGMLKIKKYKIYVVVGNYHEYDV